MSRQANFSLHSNSKGNLLKTIRQNGGRLEFVKTGRLQVRDFPAFRGIEPVVEVLCYRLGKLLGLKVADQRLDLYAGSRLGREFETLVCVSCDFRNNKALTYLQTLYIENEDAVNGVKAEYERLIKQANNIILPDIWWDRVIDFIMWRIDYVRDLRDSMEE